MKRFAACLFLVLPLLVVGCGGGGGDTPPVPEKSFRLAPSGLYNVGYFASFSVSGSNTYGLQFTGSFQINAIDLDPTDGFNDVTIHYDLETEDEYGKDLSLSTYKCYDEDKAPIIMVRAVTVDNDPNIELEDYIPTEIILLPETAKIGDSGDLTSWVSITGAQIVKETWKLESHWISSFANLVISTARTSNTGTFQGYEEIEFTVDEYGDFKAIRIEFYFPDNNVSATFYGDRVI